MRLVCICALQVTDDILVSLLPGQTSAIIGGLSHVPRVATISTVCADRSSSWERLDYEPCDLVFRDVRFARNEFGPSVAGRIISSFLRLSPQKPCPLDVTHVSA